MKGNDSKQNSSRGLLNKVKNKDLKIDLKNLVSNSGTNQQHSRIDSQTGLLNQNNMTTDNFQTEQAWETGQPTTQMKQIDKSQVQGNKFQTNAQIYEQQQRIKSNKLYGRNDSIALQQRSQIQEVSIIDEDFETQMDKIVQEADLINDSPMGQVGDGSARNGSGTEKGMTDLLKASEKHFVKKSSLRKQATLGKLIRKATNANGIHSLNSEGIFEPQQENTNSYLKQNSKTFIGGMMRKSSMNNSSKNASRIGGAITPAVNEAGEGIQDIMEEEQEIKEASQFRTRDLVKRKRSEGNFSKYRKVTSIKDPDAIMADNDTEKSITQMKTNCRKVFSICFCCFTNKVIEEEGDYKYSSGEEDDDCLEIFQAMDEEEKANHIMSLWLRTMAKLRGAVKVLEIFGDLNRRLYLYGSDKKQDYLIEHESMKPCPFVMFPYSKPKTVWNLVMMVLMVYTGVYVPYKTAFIDESEDYVNTIELSIDSLFIIDIFINFISAYEDKDRNIEFRLSRIAFVYIRSWFLIDVVSCIPFQLIDFSGGGDATTDPVVPDTAGRILERVFNQRVNYTITDDIRASQNGSNGSELAAYQKLIRLARLPRLYRLLRMMRLFKMMRVLKYNRNFKKILDQFKMNPGLMKIVTVSITVLFLVHLVSCFYFLVAKFTDLDPDCWVVRKGLQDDTNFAQYITAMYWAFQTLTTVGYGDVTGRTTIERVYCLLWMIFGVAFYSFTIGNLQSIISTIDVKASELAAKLNTLTSFAKRTKLPDTVVLKIKKYLENNNSSNSSLQDSKQLLNELPSTLRAEVVKQTYADIITKIKFFNKKDSDFLWAFLPQLKPMKVYSKDILYRQGDHPEEVFFIQYGRVKLVYDVTEGSAHPINVPYNMYVEGSYFGELEILIRKYRKTGRDGTAVVDSECHLLAITNKELKSILKYFPEEKETMLKIANKRRQHHKNAIEDAKKRAEEKKVQAIKAASLFQSGGILTNTWKKRSQNKDNSLIRAKKSRKNLEILEQKKLGVAPVIQDESQLVSNKSGNQSIFLNKKDKKSGENTDEDEDDDDDDDDDDDTSEEEEDSKDQKLKSALLESRKSVLNDSKGNMKKNDLIPPTAVNTPPLPSQRKNSSSNMLKLDQSNGFSRLKSEQPDALKLNFDMPLSKVSDPTVHQKTLPVVTIDPSHNFLTTKIETKQPQRRPSHMSNFQVKTQKLVPDIVVKSEINEKVPDDIKNMRRNTENNVRKLSNQEDTTKQLNVFEKEQQNDKIQPEQKQVSKDQKAKSSKKSSRRHSKNSKSNKESRKNSKLKPSQKVLKYDKQENFVYDHEKQMRYFNDTMNALALNAYEINDFNEQIAHTLDVRNQKLKNMENYTSNLEESINKMEKLLNKIMESI